MTNNKDFYIKIKALLDGKDIQSQLNGIAGKSNKMKDSLALSQKQLEKMKVSSGTVFKDFSKGGKDAAERVKTLNTEMSALNNGYKQQMALGDKSNKATVKALQQRQKLAQAELQTMQQVNSQHVQGMGDIIAKVGKFMVATAVLSGVTAGIYGTVQAVLDLDKSLTELSKVSSLSGESLKSFTKDAYEVGAELGRTGIEVIDAATQFAKAGFGSQDSLMLGRVATLYQNIADEEISAGDASNFLISQMKAFNITAMDSETIIDAVNQVSNKYAVSSADLATAVPKVAATMAQAGNTMSETLALVTAGTEMMPNQSSRIARG